MAIGYDYFYHVSKEQHKEAKKEKDEEQNPFNQKEF